ncbi:MAG: alpha-amylase family glycosyl hydrolase [Chloroflexota bacterium]
MSQVVNLLSAFLLGSVCQETLGNVGESAFYKLPYLAIVSITEQDLMKISRRWLMAAGIVLLILVVGLGLKLMIDRSRVHDASWFSKAIIYQVFPRSFRDSNGDGIGDIQGIIDGLDYIQSLGANTLWLNPVFKTSSNHGYDVADYYTVNPDFGTNADLIRLIREVHRRGMHILLDYVANHTSNIHPFFLDAYKNLASEYSDFYIWTNAEHSTYEHFGSELTMPRLNYNNPAVRKYMTEVATYWLDPNNDGNLDDGADGYRCDVAGGPPHEFWQQVREAMNAKNPQAVLLGEFWIDRDKIPDYLNNKEFDAAFDFPTYMALTALHETNDDGPFAGRQPISFVSDMLRKEKTLIAPNSYLVRFLNNHDTNRVMSDLGDDMQRARAAAVWLATAPGPIEMYQGEEIGMQGSVTDTPQYMLENLRSPLIWYASGTGPGQTTWYRSPKNLPNTDISIQEQDGHNDSLLTLYRTMLALRQREPALWSGEYDLPWQSKNLYVMRRWSGNTMFTIAINFDRDFITWDAPAGMLTGGQNVISMGAYDPNNGKIKFNPGGYAVYKSPLY